MDNLSVIHDETGNTDVMCWRIDPGRKGKEQTTKLKLT